MTGAGVEDHAPEPTTDFERGRAGDRDLRITVSVGGAIAAPGERAPAVFERADRALYRAKQGGRNWVELDVAGPDQDR